MEENGVRYAHCAGVLPAVVALAALCLPALSAPMMVLRNNHDVAYEGPVTFRTALPSGSYTGVEGEAEVAAGVARAVVKLEPHSEARLTRQTLRAAFKRTPVIAIVPTPGGVRISSGGKALGRIEFALAVIPGRKAGAEDALTNIQPLPITLRKQGDAFAGECVSGDYRVAATARPYDGGWLDIDTILTRISGENKPAYVALVRKITSPGISGERMRWNGRVIEGFAEPTDYNRDWWYAHGTDWASWKAGGVLLAATSAFTPGLTVEREPGRWVPANRYYVWERASRRDDAVYLLSEVAGRTPDPEAAPSSTTYVQPLMGEPVRLSWRLAVSAGPAPGWEEGQMLVFAGYRAVSESGDTATVDLGVRAVEFGTSYFPYSTLCENHDFYRTPGLDRETWWPFSPKMWENWRAFIPRMRTDLHIIGAMGFDWVRLHHVELLGQMNRDNALAFLDWYMAECRGVGLKVLVDTAGSPDWMKLITSRYKDTVKRLEIENEILIPGIKPGDTERWKACYQAAKAGRSDAQVFLTGNGNVGISERLMRMGVPFDRLGLHNYKHGEGWEEALSSIALGTGGWASEIGKPPTLGEFNWKQLTRLSPEARAEEFARVYGAMLAPRAIPEFLQFHFQETMSVNPSLCRQGIRHYETIYLDRRPKPEAAELMKLIRKYASPDAPARELPISVQEAAFSGGKAKSGFTIENRTPSEVTVRLAAWCFDGADCALRSPASVTVPPGKSVQGAVELELQSDALPGVYHFFIEADYGGKKAWGWGFASNPGKPTFDAQPSLPDKVSYPQGASIVEKIDWTKPICVAFGPDAPVVELEMAYLLFNTLQSATGRAMRLCSTADIPYQQLRQGSLVLVGTAESNPLVAKAGAQAEAGKGSVVLRDVDGGRQWLIATGAAPADVEAAAIDLVMRFWKNAKDSAIRITGTEEGAALGHRAKVGEVNPP